MQFKFTAFALAVMACGSSMAVTPAANIAISSGASASKGNFKLALINRCPGQLAEFTLPFTPPATLNANVSTYVCAPNGSFANANAPTAAEYNAAGFTPFSGASQVFAEVRYNVTNGSFSAVCLLAGWPAGTACPAADTYLDPATGSLAAAPGGSTVVGGLLDLEPNGFLADVRSGITLPAGTTTVSASFGQTFGVAVSSLLYGAMFTYQQGTGRLPIGCAVTDTAKPECVPVIGKAQMATIMTNSDGNAAQTQGVGFLTGGATSSLAGTRLNYARRVDTSGTQAVAQQYFLDNVCGPAPRTVVLQGASGTSGTTGGTVTAGGFLAVYGLGSTGNVRTLLNETTTYSIGIVSGENNQTSQNWKWVRVGGMAIGETAQPAEGGVTITNTNTALDGRYDFWFLSRIVRPTAASSLNFWNSVVTGFGAVAVNATPGLFRINETAYTKGATTSCAPVVSN